jgi:phytoene dehydrogenase-like protein
VVVGGGHNGLVAAAYLAHAGRSVLVLERNPEVGGATASHRIFPGMDANLSRYSYLVSLLPRTIGEELGLAFAPRRRRIASCTPYEQDGRARALLLSNVDLAASDAALRATAGDADLRGYQALMELERAFARLVWPSLLEPLRSRAAWCDSLRTPLERAAWEAFMERPLGEALERHVQSDLLRGVLMTDGKIGIFTHPHEESLLQNRCFIFHTIGNGTGEWQVPVGGMGVLVETLVGSAHAGGAEIETDAPVEAIHIGAPRHTVVFHHDDGERSVEATRVLVCAGPQVFARLLGETYAPTPLDEGSVCKVNMLLCRLPRLRAADVDPAEAFAGTFHVDESYSQMQESYRQAAGGELPATPPFEIYCHTLTDRSILGPELRDTGYHTLTLFGLDVPYRLFEMDHKARRAEVLRRYLQGLNRMLAEPIEDCLARDVNGDPCIEIKTPRDLERDLALNRGNIFHGALSWFFAEDDAQVGAWGVETRYERVYRCGSSALRGGAVSGIPGRNAARCIFNELRVR